MAVYSPGANVSACEITSGGKFLLLALEGNKNLLTLRLTGIVEEVGLPKEMYGDPENDGKEFEVNESEAPC